MVLGSDDQIDFLDLLQVAEGKDANLAGRRVVLQAAIGPKELNQIVRQLVFSHWCCSFGGSRARRRDFQGILER